MTFHLSKENKLTEIIYFCYILSKNTIEIDDEVLQEYTRIRDNPLRLKFDNSLGVSYNIDLYIEGLGSKISTLISVKSLVNVYKHNNTGYNQTGVKKYIDSFNRLYDSDETYVGTQPKLLGVLDNGILITTGDNLCEYTNKTNMTCKLIRFNPNKLIDIIRNALPKDRFNNYLTKESIRGFCYYNESVKKPLILSLIQDDINLMNTRGKSKVPTMKKSIKKYFDSLVTDDTIKGFYKYQDSTGVLFDEDIRQQHTVRMTGLCDSINSDYNKYQFDNPINSVKLFKMLRDKNIKNIFKTPYNYNSLLSFFMKEPSNTQKKEIKELYPTIIISSAKQFPINYPRYAIGQIKWTSYDMEKDNLDLFTKLSHIHDRCFIPKRYRNKKDKYTKEFNKSDIDYNVGNKYNSKFNKSKSKKADKNWKHNRTDGFAGKNLKHFN